MLTTGAATAVALLTLAAAGVLGVIIGALTSLVCRLPWNGSIAAWDAALAVGVSIASALALAAVAIARGRIDAGIPWIPLLMAASAVVVRHLIRLMTRATS